MKTFEFTEDQITKIRIAIGEEIDGFYRVSSDLLLRRIEHIINEIPDWCNCTGVVLVMRDDEDNPRCHKCGNIIKEEYPSTHKPGESGQIDAKWDELERTFNNKPFVPSDRTESGQRAEDVLKGLLNRGMYEFSYSANECLQAMHTYASQVCADKEEHIKSLMDNFAYETGKLESEIYRLNESLTVMLRKNAELEIKIQYSNIR